MRGLGAARGALGASIPGPMESGRLVGGSVGRALVTGGGDRTVVGADGCEAADGAVSGPGRVGDGCGALDGPGRLGDGCGAVDGPGRVGDGCGAADGPGRAGDGCGAAGGAGCTAAALGAGFAASAGRASAWRRGRRAARGAARGACRRSVDGPTASQWPRICSGTSRRQRGGSENSLRRGRLGPARLSADSASSESSLS